MPKKTDTNGFWLIKHNPVSKVGVFPYYGSNISKDCDPNKVYKVLRPETTLIESVPTWDNPPKPFIDDHEMLGEGFTPVDDRPVQGIIYNPVVEDGVLYADIAVYSEDLKHAIENGKKELSLGYFCEYKKARGVHDGEVYDYVQTNMVGNHIALVDAGRCGSDVKVFDKKCAMDALDIRDMFEKAATDAENEKKDTDASEELKNALCKALCVDYDSFKSNDLKKTGKVEKIILTTERKEVAMNKISIEEVRAALTEAFSYDIGDGKKELDPKVKLVMEVLELKAEKTATDEEEIKTEVENKEVVDKCGTDEETEKETEKESEKQEVKTEDMRDLIKAVRDMAESIKEIKAEKEESKTEDEDEKADKEKASEDEEKETEDEDADKDDEKTAEDAVFVLKQRGAAQQDAALQEYLK